METSVRLKESMMTKKGNLVVTRRKGESIDIGDDIVVTITEIGKSQVRLKISAPKTVKVLRCELRR